MLNRLLEIGARQLVLITLYSLRRLAGHALTLALLRAAFEPM
jgi:hypothetical protein